MVSRSKAWTVAIVAMLTMTVSYIDRSTLSALGKTITDDLHLSETQFGWLASAFALAYLVATPLAGWWIDRIGARRGLVFSILVWTTIAALHAVVPGFWTLFALRIALGLAEGPSFPGAAQTVQRILPPAERARGFGVLFTGSSIGGMIAPILAGFLFGQFHSWRVAMLGTVLVGLIWIPLWILITRQRDVRPILDVAPAPRTATPGRSPSLFDLARSRNMIRALAAIFAVAPIFGFVQMWGAKYLARAFDVPQKNVGHYLWLPPLVFDIGTIIFGDLASRQRRAPGAPPRALFALALVLATTMVFLPYSTSIWQSMTMFGIAMAGGGGVYALTTSDLLSRTPAESVSLTSGTLAGAQSLAVIITSPLLGASVDRWHTYSYAAIALGIWAIPGTLYWLFRRPV